VTTQVVILAAGMGSRLGRSLPKPLTELSDGRTIMQQQFDNIHAAFGKEAKVTIVVGYKLEHIIEAFPDASFVYNEQYDQTNTSKSLLRAARHAGPGGLLWMNGDVVFEPEVLDELVPYVDSERSAVCVNTASVAEEEVKYTVDEAGFIRELSKTVQGALGEAVGINYIAPADLDVLRRNLEACAEQDYFERAIERATLEDGLRVLPVDISRWFCVEVDSQSDLDVVNSAVSSGSSAPPAG
jgi:choline kinase